MNKKSLLALLFTFIFGSSLRSSEESPPSTPSLKTLSKKSSNSADSLREFPTLSFFYNDCQKATNELFMGQPFPPIIDYDDIYNQVNDKYALPYLRTSVEYARNLAAFLYKKQVYSSTTITNIKELIHDHKDKSAFEYFDTCAQCQSQKIPLTTYARYLSDTIDLNYYRDEFQIYDHDRLPHKQKKRIIQNSIIYAQSILYIQRILDAQNVPYLEQLVNFIFKKDPDIAFGVIVEPPFIKSRTMLFNYLETILTNTSLTAEEKTIELQSLDLDFLTKLATANNEYDTLQEKTNKEKMECLVVAAYALLNKESGSTTTLNT